MKTDPDEITGLKDIQSYKIKAPDLWSNLKDKSTLHVKPKRVKVLSRLLIHFK